MMRKRMIHQDTRPLSPLSRQWLDLETLAQVELTSEAEQFPIESAFTSTEGPGWRAEQPGRQVIKVLFDTPQQIRHIHLEFREHERERTQEFVLRWSANGKDGLRDVVRQQYTFAPPDNVQEVEEYAVELDGLTELELEIVPDIGQGVARASLGRLLLG